jgi:hypothetical protein
VSPPSEPRPRLAVPLTIVVAIITTAVAYYGTRDTPPLAALPVTAVSAATVDDTVRSIALPQLDVALPPGPHQKEFVVACTTCHSARLVLNQPPLDRKKWDTIVQKMVKTFKAPIAAEQEPAVMEYLLAIRGQ